MGSQTTPLQAAGFALMVVVFLRRAQSMRDGLLRAAARGLGGRRCPRPPPAGAPDGTLRSTCCSLNSSLNLLNRWSLGVYGFRFPFLLTSCEPVLHRALAAVQCRRPGYELAE